MGVQVRGRIKCDVCSRNPIACWLEQIGPTNFAPVDLPSAWKIETRSGYRERIDNEAAEAVRKAEAAEMARQIERGERVPLGGGLGMDLGNVLSSIHEFGFDVGGAMGIANYVEPSDRLVTCSADCRKAFESQVRLSNRTPEVMKTKMRKATSAMVFTNGAE